MITQLLRFVGRPNARIPRCIAPFEWQSLLQLSVKNQPAIVVLSKFWLRFCGVPLIF